MLSRQTAQEARAKRLGDVVRIGYSSRGISREKYAESVGVSPDVIKGVVDGWLVVDINQGEISAFDRATLERVVSGLRVSPEGNEVLNGLIEQLTPLGYALWFRTRGGQKVNLPAMRLEDRKELYPGMTIPPDNEPNARFLRARRSF